MTAAIRSISPEKAGRGPGGARPHPGLWNRLFLALFIGIPIAAMLSAIPVAWGWGLTWRDVIIATVMYAVSGHGITVGFHRYFTHRSFKASRPLRVALAIAGSLAVQGEVIRWVADHRKHHRFSDRDGDPHSPWRYGQSLRGLAKGMLYAHVGWIVESGHAPQREYAPDLLADPDIAGVSRLYPAWAAMSVFVPPLAGGLWSMSWAGAVTAFFWATLVRVGLFHHVTWSINSVCHVAGKRPLRSHDRSGNVWWLSVLSMGESWHNVHHADPTCARHGALRGQVDSSARVIQVLEALGWAWDVRWPDARRLATRRVG